jgi:hypothetical protein
MYEWDSCAVAEAHRGPDGWRDTYSRWAPDTPQRKYCNECEFTAFSFLYIICGHELTLDEELLQFKEKQFAAHFLEHHLPVARAHMEKIDQLVISN